MILMESILSTDLTRCCLVSSTASASGKMDLTGQRPIWSRMFLLQSESSAEVCQDGRNQVTTDS